MPRIASPINSRAGYNAETGFRYRPGVIDDTSPGDIGPLARLGPVALALWLQSATHALAAELAEEGIPALILKGPDLQARLYGTPATYASGDVDILIHARDRARTIEFLQEGGWTFEPANGLFWRLSRAASFRRESVCLDLHWGLHAAHLPSSTLRAIERELWRGAAMGPAGLYEPRAEALMVYLAVHAAGHNYERLAWLDNPRRAAELVEDWPEVDRIAREARVTRLVHDVLGEGVPETGRSLLDGSVGAGIWWSTWFLRGHFLSAESRASLKELAWRVSNRSATQGMHHKTFAGLRLEVYPGVFEPRHVSEEVLQLALDNLPSDRRACLVDVGTGTGAIALAAAKARPDALIVGIDVSPRAVACARANARRLGIENARFVRGSLLDPLPEQAKGRVDVIAANLPYVPATYARGTDWEAPLSTVEGSGIDGLNLLREFVDQGGPWLRSGGWLVTQVIDWQWDILRDELAELGFTKCIEPPVRRPRHAVAGAVSKELQRAS
jgi:release factor glutamine methyltransferase